VQLASLEVAHAVARVGSCSCEVTSRNATPAPRLHPRGRLYPSQ
jgi:hypothetical protein